MLSNACCIYCEDYCFRRWRGTKSEKPNEVIRLPIVISVLIMIAFLAVSTVFIYYLDAFSGPPGTGLDWFHSFYFSYMSFTTIGLGDVMPNNATFAPIVSILFFLGLPILKVVNRMTYLTVENGAFGMLTVIENRIDNYWEGKQPSSGEVENGAKEENAKETDKDEIPAEWVNNITIHSIATFMKANKDVYGGSFGKVNLRAADVLPQNEQDTIPAEWVNNITIHSIATFMKANKDVYGGSFGKVNLRAADVLPQNEQDTVLSRRSHR
ncbi:Ion channel [Necator americanus]|uniref:Ion channel n=1 Tax=Necator americanus TaxID=51031 RepID=W2TAV6_NECAM|nr:Ion channel [Necator americanus]ETN78301.1 Ion channel [Necator americanus]